MAKPLNPYAETNLGNYLGYSRGQDAYNVAGGIAAAGSKILTAKVSATDELIKMRIDEEARQKVEPIRDAATHALETGQLSGASIPEEVRGGLSRAEQLTMAKSSGRLNESHYWSLLDAEARRLRAQHPGYKDYVDQRIAALTGANPANRLVQTLYDEQQALARGGRDTATREREKWEKEYIDLGLAGDPKGPTGRDLSSMTTEELKRDVSQRRSQMARIKEEETDINLRKMRGEEITRNVEFSAQKEIENTVAGTLKAGMKPFDKLIESWGRISSSQGKDQLVAPKDMDQLRLALAETERVLKQGASDVFTKKREGDLTWGQFLDDKKKKEIMESALHPFMLIKDAILNSDTGTIGAMKNRIEALERTDVHNILSTNTFARKAAASREIFGPQWAAFAQLTGDLLKEAGQGASYLDAVVDSTKEGASLKGAMDKFAEDKAVKPIVYNTTVDRHISNLRVATPDTKAWQASAAYFFGPNNNGMFATQSETGKISPKFRDGHTLYQKMAGDPVIATNMAKIKNTDPKTYNNWKNFVLSNFDTLMGITAQSAQSVVDTNKAYTVKWDDKALQLQVVARTDLPGQKPPLGGSGLRFPTLNLNAAFSAVADPIMSTQARSAVTQINQVLSGLKALYTAEGVDANAAIVEKMSTLPLNLNSEFKGNIWDQMMGTFKDSKKEADAKENKGTGITGPKNQSKLTPEDLPEGGRVMVRRNSTERVYIDSKTGKAWVYNGPGKPLGDELDYQTGEPLKK